MTTTITYKSTLERLKKLPAGKQRLSKGWYSETEDCFCTLGQTYFPKKDKERLSSLNKIKNKFSKLISQIQTKYYGKPEYSEKIGKNQSKFYEKNALYSQLFTELANLTKKAEKQDHITNIIRANDNFEGKPGARYRHMVKWLTAKVKETEGKV